MDAGVESVAEFVIVVGPLDGGAFVIVVWVVVWVVIAIAISIALNVLCFTIQIGLQKGR